MKTGPLPSGPLLGDRVKITVVVNNEPAVVHGTCRGVRAGTLSINGKVAQVAAYEVFGDDGVRYGPIPADAVTLIERCQRQTVPGIRGPVQLGG